MTRSPRLFAALALTLAASAAAGAEEYRLSVGDVLRVTVMEQPELSIDETRVQPGGQVMLPRLGSLSLDGMTAAEARDMIAARLRDEQGLTRPDVLVEITAYRPVFVAGDVERPGSYEYMPGMTVLQAISLAGSFVRPEPADAAIRVEQGRLRQELAQHRLQIALAMVRRHRLVAERDGIDLTRPEAALVHVPAAQLDGFLVTEAAIKAKRQIALQGELEIMARLQAELDREVEALRAQLAAKERQTALVQEEAEKVRELAARDLVSLQRSLAVRSAEIQIDADKLEILSFISRAQTSRGRIDQDALNLRNARALEILDGIKEQEDTIAQAAANIAAVEAQIAVVDRLAVGVAANQLRAEGQIGTGEIAVIRGSGTGQRVIPVTLFDRLEPDDVLFVPYQGVQPVGPLPHAASN